MCRNVALVLLTLLLPVSGRAAAAPENADGVLAVMERAADWQLAHPTRHDPRSWVYGPFYAGVVALAEISPAPRFSAATQRIGEQTEWKPGPDPYNADDQVVGQAYLELYLQDRRPELIKEVRQSFDFVLQHPKTLWYWCDALFMGPPTWARMTAATGDRGYLDYAITFWDTTTRLLYDDEEKLFFRDESFIPQRTPGGRKIFWARGNGWVLAGLARLLPFVPADHPARPRLEAQFRAMAARIAALQQPDGLWRASLLDPENYPAAEASGSAFFVFGLAWGVNQGLLERSRYEPVIARGWAAVERCVQADGKLIHVQPIGAAPDRFPADANEPYGVGALLLAGSEVYRLQGGPVPAAVAATSERHAPAWTRGVDDRARWCAFAARIADPVLHSLRHRRLKATMPVEAINPAERAACTHLEAFARLLVGIAPWLELGDDGTAEGFERARLARLALAGIDAATDPTSPDRMNFPEGGQPLVDAAFLAQALLRAPTVLLERLDPRVRGNVVTCLKSTRTIQPYPSNWLLFASMVEVALQRLGEPRDDARLFEGLKRFQEWYVGDGVYGDGPEFHWDYYNAYVIQPMLGEILDTVGDESPEWSAFREKVWVRARRYAAVQERLIAPDGSFPVIGRSIAYRGAAMHGLAQAALRRELPENVTPGQARAALTAVIERTLEPRGTFDDRGWLRIGLAGHQPSLGETYISTGSLYLCTLAFAPLGLPASDPFWTEPRAATTWEKAWSGVDLPADKALKSPR